MNGEEAPATAQDVPVSIRYVGGRRMQCKDIPTPLFLDCVNQAVTDSGWTTATHRHVLAVLEPRVGPVPWNLFLAKARNLIAQGRLDGCACGCAGDFRVLERPEG